tara:strand:+ start:9191 stop:9508 length:318 start_codon:yes stop_codon:yes gene_type:complete
MFSTLFNTKRKTTLDRSFNNNNKMFHKLLDVLLTDLEINIPDRLLTNDHSCKEDKKVSSAKKTEVLSDDLKKIEMNQLAYSKLMAKKLQKTKLGKIKGKSILLHS